jgi:hypothetical protein
MVCMQFIDGPDKMKQDSFQIMKMVIGTSQQHSLKESVDVVTLVSCHYVKLRILTYLTSLIFSVF